MWKKQGSWNFFHAKLIPNSSIYRFVVLGYLRFLDNYTPHKSVATMYVNGKPKCSKGYNCHYTKLCPAHATFFFVRPNSFANSRSLVKPQPIKAASSLLVFKW